MPPHDDLVFDIGAHNGDDTAYYLHRDFRVVSVEANPMLVEDIRARFGPEQTDGRLTVLNVGIAACAGTLPFWVNDDESVWSSFDRDLGGRHGSRCHSVPIPCVPLASLIAAHGIPQYIKIDIEGYDRVCLDSLNAKNRPRYISCEVTHGDGLIERLAELGYCRFKLVNQGTFTDAPPVFDHQLLSRGLRKICAQVSAAKRLIPNGIRSDFDTFAEAGGYRLPPGSSGPFWREHVGELEK